MIGSVRREDQRRRVVLLWVCATSVACLVPALVLAEESKTPDRRWSAEQRKHWSFIPPQRPTPPSPADLKWVRNPIDAFVLDQIEAAELKPSPEADRATLIRRLSFDLIGLPPTAEEVKAFVLDSRPDAYERLVDQFLASPRFGERWARVWLDLARFAESDGFKSDVTRPNAWRYRDWVIRALNQDMPYDQFVRLQVAGDELFPNDPEAFVATGFNRNYPFEDNNMVPGLNRQLMLDDVTDTTSSVFMGLTLACARCHDHKYDPLSQKDYYRLQAVYGSIDARDDFPLASPIERAVYATVGAEVKAREQVLKRTLDQIEKPYKTKLLASALKKLPEEARRAFATDPIERSAFQEDLLAKFASALAVPASKMESALSRDDRKIWSERSRLMKELKQDEPPALAAASGMADARGKVPPVRLMRKGNFFNPGEVIQAGIPSIFAAIDAGMDWSRNATRSESETPPSPRVAFAEWLTRPDHPLTSRVIVNRLWQNHFGRGLVATSSDFGTQGAEPTHPELLDWLATELIRSGWSLKAIHRLIVTSATYRQSSGASSKSMQVDPDNSLWSRCERRRIDAEMVRDALLAVAGKLNLAMGGPSVFPDLPPGVQTRAGWPRSQSEAERNRRSIYVFVRRNLKYPLFDAFDFPDTNITCSERNVSVNAPQALMLLNSDLVLEWCRSLASRAIDSTAAPDRSNPRALVGTIYRLVLARDPTPAELNRATSFLDSQARLSREGDKADRAEDAASLRTALADLAHVLVNLNEFVFVD